MTREAAPTSSIINLVRRTCSDFIELRRGKAFLGEDQLVSGFATLGHRSIGVLILCKNDHGSNNGVSIPNHKRLNGYQKTQHLFRLAKKFNRPIVMFTNSPASLPGTEMSEPDEALGFAKHVLSQSYLEVPIILVLLSRIISCHIFGAWLADKIIALEDAHFLMTIFDQGKVQLIQVEARHLLRQGIIDKTISESVCGGPASQVMMPTPRQLRIILGEILDEVSRVTPEELMLRRREKIEKAVARILPHFHGRLS